MEEHQVVIVGGGPAGTGTATILAGSGIDTLVLEGRPEVGEPVQCAGLISPRTYEMSGAFIPVLNEIKGGRIHSPGGRSIYIRSQETKAFVVDRMELDRSMASMAREAGAAIRCGTRVTGIRRNDGAFLIDYEDEDGTGRLRSEYVIGADGARSLVRQTLEYPEPREMLHGFGTHGYGASIPPDEVVIITGEDIAPGFFAWIIPEGREGRARVGLCVPSTKGSPASYYDRLMEHPVAMEHLGDYKADLRIAGNIGLGLLDVCVSGKSALVGDSAAMAKPTSGGGIYPALTAAGSLAKAVIDDVHNGSDGSSLSEYQKFLDTKMRREIDTSMAGRRLYNSVTPRQLDSIFDILGSGNVVDFLSKKGDIDHPLDLVPGLLAKVPGLATLGFSLLPALLKWRSGQRIRGSPDRDTN